MKTLPVSALVFLLVALVLPQGAKAADEPNCLFGPRLERLKAIQADGSQNYIDAIRAQLEVRKSLLRSAIDCGLKEIRLRQEKLKAVPADLQDSKIQKEISVGLNDTIDYYSNQRDSIDNLGIKGTQDLAKDIAAWRASNYAPLAERQDSFLVWSENQQLFSKAESRFSQIRPVVLSLSILDQDKIKSSFKEAEDSFDKAEDANRKAKEALEQGDRQAPELVKSSLEPLSDIYKKFLDISDQIKKIVP